MAPKYSPQIVARTAEGRKLSAQMHGIEDPKACMSYAGPGQHMRVESAVRDLIDGEVTAKSVLEVVGLSGPKLKTLATTHDNKGDLKALRPLGRSILTATGEVDTWATGRYLAAILSVWVLDLRREERAAKKAPKVAVAA